MFLPVTNGHNLFESHFDETRKEMFRQLDTTFILKFTEAQRNSILYQS